MLQNTEALAEGYVTTWAGVTRVLASTTGIREAQLPDWHAQSVSDAVEQRDRVAPEIAVLRSPSRASENHLRAALDQLSEYFMGVRQIFTVPLDPHGPDFFQRVWTAVARVPYGETRSYAEIARSIGSPKAMRAVGAANGANPVAPFVPCHRIVGSDGRLTGYGPGLPLKETLLIMEDAMPPSPDEYASWLQRLTARADGASIYLGLHHANVYCNPNCARFRPQPHRSVRVFHTQVEATSAGFSPCPSCNPDLMVDTLRTPQV